MAIEITNTSQPASAGKAVRGTAEVVAGQQLKIESSPSGIEIAITDPVPAGKKWTAHINIDIIETDV